MADFIQKSTENLKFFFYSFFFKWIKHIDLFQTMDLAQAEIMILCRLRRSVKCWSNVGDRLSIANVGTMLENNWPNLVPTVEKVIYR